MAYLDPAFNPGSKQQKLGATNCKNSTSDTLRVRNRRRAGNKRRAWNICQKE